MKFINICFFSVILLFSLFGTSQAQSLPIPLVNEALVTWTYTGPTPANFTVERKLGACSTAGTFSEISQPSATARFFLDTSLSRGTTYCYRMFTVGTFPGDKSIASNTAQKTIPTELAAPVIGVQ